jgi:hypothetical protein
MPIRQANFDVSLFDRPEVKTLRIDSLLWEAESG